MQASEKAGSIFVSTCLGLGLGFNPKVSPSEGGGSRAVVAWGCGVVRHFTEPLKVMKLARGVLEKTNTSCKKKIWDGAGFAFWFPRWGLS